MVYIFGTDILACLNYMLLAGAVNQPNRLRKEMDIQMFLVHGDREKLRCPPSVFYLPDWIQPKEEERLMAAVDSAPKPKWTQLKGRRLLNYGGVPHEKGMIKERVPDWINEYFNKVYTLGVVHTVPNHLLVNEYQPGQGIMPHFDGPLFQPYIITISLGASTMLEFYRPSRIYGPEGRPSMRSPGKLEPDTQKPEEAAAAAAEELFTAGTTSSPNKNELIPEKTAAGYKGYSTTADIPTPPSNVSPLPNDKYLIGKLLIEPRSVLILTEDMYEKYMHCIQERDEDVIDDTVMNLSNCSNKYHIGDRVKRVGRRVSLTFRHVPKTTQMELFFDK